MPLAEMEGVQEGLARIAGNTYVMQSAQMLTNAMLNHHEQPAVISAIMKQQMTARIGSCEYLPCVVSFGCAAVANISVQALFQSCCLTAFHRPFSYCQSPPPTALRQPYLQRFWPPSRQYRSTFS